MYGSGGLAATGAGITLFGQHVGLGLPIAIGVGLVLVGAAAYRWTTRSKRYAS